MPDIHANLSASGSYRWSNCPGSVRLESYFENTTSLYAEEGTEAHAFAEEWLNLALAKKEKELIDFKLKFRKKNSEMFSNVEFYVNECLNLFESCLLIDCNAQAYVELRVDFSEFVPGGFGTCDFVVVTSNAIYIKDLKYGKGVKVEAKDNSQLRLYAIGAYLMFDWLFDFKKVNYGIIQPRLSHVDEEEISVDELLSFGKLINKKAKLTLDPNAKTISGDWCKFCRAKSCCKTRGAEIFSELFSILGKE